MHTCSLFSGGVHAILRRMDVHNCKPDIRTFLYLLKALPYSTEAEDKLLEIMKVLTMYGYISTGMNLLLQNLS